MKHSNRIVQFFEENFNEKKCHDLCIQSGFIKRSSGELKGQMCFEEMENDIPRILLKEKRSRRNMREKVSVKEAYYRMLLIENQLIA